MFGTLTNSSKGWWFWASAFAVFLPLSREFFSYDLLWRHTIKSKKKLWILYKNNFLCVCLAPSVACGGLRKYLNMTQILKLCIRFYRRGASGSFSPSNPPMACGLSYGVPCPFRPNGIISLRYKDLEYCRGQISGPCLHRFSIFRTLRPNFLRWNKFFREWPPQ